MDFLDPKKQKAHVIRLAIGYVVTGLVLLLATVILLYQAYGYGIDRQGNIFQNGLVFLSSSPGGADIYANGERKDATSARLALPAGQYVFELRREGYRPWKRAIGVEGGSLQRFDYPFLFPVNLETSQLRAYGSMPGFASQSLDRRWLLVQAPAENTFDLYDLAQTNLIPQTLAVPADILSAGTTTVGWEAVEWAKDDRHLLVRRQFERSGQRSSELLLLDRERPADSRNLTVLLGFTPSSIELRDENYDQYYVFDQPNGTLFTASLDKPTPQLLLSKIVAFASEQSDMLLYATTLDAAPGKILIKLREGDKDYLVRQVASDAAPVLLDVGNYDGSWFVVAGAAGEHKMYVYKNPLDTLKKGSDQVAVPVHILKVNDAKFLDFAPDDRFVVAENGNKFALYDAKTGKGYAYELPVPANNAAGHSSWMDGFRLQIRSGEQLVVFDYDGTNQQNIIATGPTHIPYYDPNYRKLYTFSPAAVLNVTQLRTANDR